MTLQNAAHTLTPPNHDDMTAAAHDEDIRWITDIHTHILPRRIAVKIRAVFESVEGLQAGPSTASDDIPHGRCCTPAYAAVTSSSSPAFTDHGHFTLRYPSHDVGDGAMAALLADNGVRTVWVLPYAHRGGRMAQQLNADVAQICRGSLTTSAGPALDAFPALTVHPDDGLQGVHATTLDALTRLKCRAAKLHCSVGAYGIAHPNLAPFWRLANDVRLPVVVHFGKHISGHTGADELDDVATLVTTYPHVRLILAHSAAPSTKRAIALADAHDNVYLDTTPIVTHCVEYPARQHALHATLLRLARRGKVLFGSDFPNVAVTLAEQMQHVFATFSDDAQWTPPAEPAQWWTDRGVAEQAGRAVVEVLGDAAKRLLDGVLEVTEQQQQQRQQRM